MPDTKPKLPACPICQRPAQAAFRPFCSARCADVDLGRWLTGTYRVPGELAEDAAGTRATGAEGE